MAEETLSRIQVRADGEYGSFYVLEGNQQCEDGTTRYWCELTCNTSFGVVGHTWGYMGRPAAQFFAKSTAGYLLNKLWGPGYMVYDETTARTALKEHLLRERRNNDLSYSRARELWDDLADADLDSEHAHVLFVYSDSYWTEIFTSGEGPDYKHQNRQATGFWKYLWPGFLAQLAQRAEVAANG